ncbi:hypothetical protein FOZ63_001670 [Perkinsus olseni]|uniref:Uncharacterized protein n=1 Tax=Perkinsus olseni TaxID=32597 RepID=A0A7J6UM82_PEROL|nr:hypothetical protein FOZ63_001670 [Perkinsus olseni]
MSDGIPASREEEQVSPLAKIPIRERLTEPRGTKKFNPKLPEGLLAKTKFQLTHNAGSEAEGCRVEARPAVLHFSGAKVHTQYKERLRIVNAGGRSVRVTIIPPSSPWIRLEFAKVGLLAPGMSQEIDVVVVPVDYKYKFEWIKVLCGPAAPSAGPKSWALQVPVHVYATANKLVEGELPSIVDFGRVPIGEKAERRFVLRCDVPLEFDFEFLHLRRHPDIEVTVDRCRITPETPAELCLEYRPTSYTSAVAEIEVVLAQFGGEPSRRIKISGSCLPGLKQAEVETKGLLEIEEEKRQLHDMSIIKRVEKLMEKSKNRQRMTKRATSELSGSEESEKLVNGLYVPESKAGRKLTQNQTGYVLMQKPGKAPLKHLKGYIEEVRSGKVKEREDWEKRKQATREMAAILWRAVFRQSWAALMESYNTARRMARREIRLALAEEVAERAAQLEDEEVDEEDEVGADPGEADPAAVAGGAETAGEVLQDDDFEKDARTVEARRLIEERGVGIASLEEESSSEEEMQDEQDLSADAKLLMDIAMELREERRAEKAESPELNDEVVEETAEETPADESEHEQQVEAAVLEEREEAQDTEEGRDEEGEVGVDTAAVPVESSPNSNYWFKEPATYDFRLGRAMPQTLAFAGALLAGRTAQRPHAFEDFTKCLSRIRVLDDIEEGNLLSDTDSDGRDNAWELPLCAREEALATFGLEGAFALADVAEEACAEVGRVEQARDVIKERLRRLGEELMGSTMAAA